MIILSLNSLGPALSSRSLARNIAESVSSDHAKVVLDFSGIQACNQSFLNEILLVLMVEKKIPAAGIETRGLESISKHIADRFEKEFLFFQNIVNS